MTPEQEAFTKAITRLMRMGGKLFLAFWLLMCGAMGIMAICALLGVPDGAKSSGTPTVWAGMLLGSLAAAGVGWLFMGLWRRAIDSFESHIPGGLRTDASGDRQAAADIKDGRGISTSTHISLQFFLSLVGGLVGCIICIVFFRNSFASHLTSGIVFVMAVGIGTVIPRLVIFFLIPARCPNCSGRAYCRGSSPITFVCRNCNHIHNTGISIGSED